jgi:hypothetical protein
LQSLAERETQLHKAREEHKQYGAWLVEAHQQQAAETARLQALAATLAAQEEQMRMLVLQVGGVSAAAMAGALQDSTYAHAGFLGGGALHSGNKTGLGHQGTVPASDLHMPCQYKIVLLL